MASRNENDSESLIVRIICELKVPAVLTMIVGAVWAVSHAQRMEELTRVYRMPAQLVAHDMPEDEEPDHVPANAEEILTGVTDEGAG